MTAPAATAAPAPPVETADDAPPLSPAAADVLARFHALPRPDRAAVADRVACGDAPDAHPAPGSPTPESLLRELEHEAAEVAAGRLPSHTAEEVDRELDELLATPPDRLPDDLRAAWEAGRAARDAAAGETR